MKKTYSIEFRLAPTATVTVEADSEDEALDAFACMGSDDLYLLLTDDGTAAPEFKVVSMTETSGSAARGERNADLLAELMGYIVYNGLDQDVKAYANGHRYSTEAGDAGEDRPAICTQYRGKPVVFYDEGEFDVGEYVEYFNADTITLTFEGPLYTAYNGYDDDGYRVADDIDRILAKHGLYAEQGYAWSLAAYEDPDR